MTRWLDAVKADNAAKSEDPNARLEFVAEHIWKCYIARVSGPKLIDAPGANWDDQDSQTVRLYLHHAAAAMAAIEKLDRLK